MPRINLRSGYGLIAFSLNTLTDLDKLACRGEPNDSFRFLNATSYRIIFFVPIGIYRYLIALKNVALIAFHLTFSITIKVKEFCVVQYIPTLYTLNWRTLVKEMESASRSTINLVLASIPSIVCGSLIFIGGLMPLAMLGTW